MIKTASVTFSSDKKNVGFCHEGGQQLTFWSHEDQSFFGMLKLGSPPQSIAAAETPGEFIVGLKGTPSQRVKVNFETIEATPVGKSSLSEVIHIKGG